MALDCSLVLLPILNPPLPIIIPYESISVGGLGKVFQIADFYTYTPLAGCIVSCNFGETAGESTAMALSPLSKITKTITSVTVPPVFPN